MLSLKTIVHLFCLRLLSTKYSYALPSGIDSDITSAYNQQISFVHSALANNEELNAVVSTKVTGTKHLYKFHLKNFQVDMSENIIT